MKEDDVKGGNNKSGLINVDIFMNLIIMKYRMLVNRAKVYVKNAFAASDLDGNGYCDIDEFLLLNRHIEVLVFDTFAVVNCKIVTD